MSDQTTRPGGWVNGIGWVAPLHDTDGCTDAGRTVAGGVLRLVLIVSVPLCLLYATAAVVVYVRLGRVLWLAKDAPTEEQP